MPNTDPRAAAAAAARRRELALASAAALFALALAHFRAGRNAGEHTVKVELREWDDVASAALERDLPTAPTLLRGSPMQAWLRSANGSAWDVSAIATLAASSRGDEFRVHLNSQTRSPLPGVYGERTFLHHFSDRYQFYDFAGGGEGSTSRHSRRVTTLREAVGLLWSQRGAGETQHYLSAQMDDFVPELVAPLVETILPEGCLRDDRWEAAAVWEETVDLSGSSDCRDLNAVRAAPPSAPTVVPTPTFLP